MPTHLGILKSDYSLSGGNLDLKDELVKFFSDRLSIDNILITSGGKPALFCALQSFTQIASSWLIPTPYWVSYPDMIRMLYGNSIFIETEVEKNWLPDIDKIEEYYKDEKVNGIIICNPNNPTGMMYPEEFLDKLVILTDKYNKKIIIDEVYLPLIAADDLDYKASLYFKSPNVISVWSFSKGWGMAGWRLGFVLAEAQIIKKLTGIQSTINTCPPMASQQIALKMIQDKWLPIQEFKKIDRYKKELISIYREKGWIIPDNYITSMYLFPINYHIDINKYIDTLFEKGLAVISGEPFGNKYGIRLTIYNDEKIMDQYIRIIKENT
jgi:aspartate aminotransferase